MVEKSKPSVCIVGPLPPPYGGVSEHVLRLIYALPQLICEVIDLYPEAAPKHQVEDSSVRFYVAPTQHWVKFIWFFFRCIN